MKIVENLQKPRTAIYVLGIIAMLILTMVLVELLMNPPLEDLLYLATLLGITSLGSAIFGFVSHRFGWWRRLPSISQSLILGYILAGGLTLFNVWLTARLMFINHHDFILGSLLLIFAGGISVAFGFFISNSITHTLRDLVKGAEKLSQGDFSTRVTIEGEDEVAQLAHAFNNMAAKLEQAAEDERALEEARRNLIVWASHDLRTPLASLRAMLDAIADGVVSDELTINRYINQSQSEINQMSDLIDDLLMLAQIETGHVALDYDLVSLSDMISDTLEGFAAQASAREVALSGHVDSLVDPVWIAPDKISRVLNNLVGNAIQYTNKGGTILLQAEIKDDNVIVTTRDTGRGISEEDLPNIFNRFYRGEKSRSRDTSGTSVGLGLAIAKGLVEAHGGEIWAESTLGQGTIMRFTLPKNLDGIKQVIKDT
ncbi:MAG: ATP-binding protein [Anaerolineales bacterium]|jgi:signal transduction histidine kinase